MLFPACQKSLAEFGARRRQKFFYPWIYNISETNKRVDSQVEIL